MKKAIVVSIASLIVFSVFPTPASAAFQTYYIEGVVDYNTLVLSRYGSFYKVDFSFGCSFNSFDQGKSILIDSFLSPSFGDDVVFDDIITEICTVTFSDTLNFQSFTIESVLDSNTLVISRLSSYYDIDLSYDCSLSSLDRGKQIQVDSFLSPGYGNTVLFNDFLSADVCTVSSSDSLNIKSYSVTNNVAYDKVIIQDSYGSKYVIQYGLGCSSISYYFGTLHIDVGGVFLDGISDTIYLFEKGQSCKVWDADEVVKTPVSGSLPSQTPSNPPVTQPSPQVLGEEAVVLSIKKITMKNGEFKIWVGKKLAIIKPFGEKYKGDVWGRKVSFSDKVIYVFVPIGQKTDGNLRVYNNKGKVISTKLPFQNNFIRGLAADIIVDPLANKVFLATSQRESGKVVQIYEVTSRGLTTRNKLNASNSKSGYIVAKYKPLYTDGYGLVTFLFNTPKTIKVWYFDSSKGKFIQDRRFGSKDFRLKGDKISVK